MRNKKFPIWLSATLLTAASSALQVQAANPLETDQLVELSFDELLGIEITSVSKKAESLRDAPAAVFVITNEDLRRSGARSIPDALRMVPGVQVAQIDANKWAVTARSFNSRFANKLLVLVDGRSVYSPLYSGVYWESQSPMLEDIERIEVIRGPGATLWGANAVNGVINIISKTAAETAGSMAFAGAGSHEKVFGGARDGFTLGADTDARVYLKYEGHNAFELAGGGTARDDWDNLQTGFRADHRLDGDTGITIQGDINRQKIDKLVYRPTLTPPYTQVWEDSARSTGANLLGRWTRALEDDGELQIQAYVDYFQRDEFYVDQSVWTWDLDLQHRFSPAPDHDLVWGLGYRVYDLALKDLRTVEVANRHHSNQLFSAFIQDDITLVPDRWKLTLGTKLEHNDFTGFEIQPSARIAFKPEPRQTVWGAISRAVRTPSVGEQESTIAVQTIPPFTGINALSPFPLQLVLNGDRFSESETVNAFEAGWRFEASQRLSLDVAAYYNEYEKGRYASRGATNFILTPPLHTQQEVDLANGGYGEQWGVELALDWRAGDALGFQLSYSHQRIFDHSETGEADLNEGSSPRNQASLRTDLKISPRLEANLWLRYVDQLSGIGVNSVDNVTIPAYTEADLQLTWRPQSNVEVSLVGRNLLSSSHAEFVQETFTLPTEVERSVYGYLKVDF
jgi:iron complex outermembrane receptor protein